MKDKFSQLEKLVIFDVKISKGNENYIYWLIVNQ